MLYGQYLNATYGHIFHLTHAPQITTLSVVAQALCDL